MFEYETGFVELIDGKYEVFSPDMEECGVCLDYNQFYAIFVKEEIYDKRDDEKIEIESHYFEASPSDIGDMYYTFAFEDYPSYLYEVEQLQSAGAVHRC